MDEDLVPVQVVDGAGSEGSRRGSTEGHFWSSKMPVDEYL